jgi:hypothetical protein
MQVFVCLFESISLAAGACHLSRGSINIVNNLVRGIVHTMCLLTCYYASPSRWRLCYALHLASNRGNFRKFLAPELGRITVRLCHILEPTTGPRASSSQFCISTYVDWLLPANSLGRDGNMHQLQFKLQIYSTTSSQSPRYMRGK